jgi:hypothetical protein
MRRAALVLLAALLCVGLLGCGPVGYLQTVTFDAVSWCVRRRTWGRPSWRPTSTTRRGST